MHSGDSACVIPPMSLGEEMLDEIRETTRRIALELGVIGLINIQYAVAGGAPVRDRGQPARLAHGAVRLQGDRRAAGEDRLPADARRAARRDRAADDAQRPRLGQGGGAAVRPLRRRRLGARPGDEVDRRGDGDRRRLPDRVRQGPGRRRASRCPTTGTVFITRHRHRQGGGHAARGALPRPRLPRSIATRGTAQAISRMGIPVDRDQQDRRGLAARRRLHPRRRGRHGDQHADRQRRALRRLRDPHRRGARAGSPASRR